MIACRVIIPIIHVRMFYFIIISLLITHIFTTKYNIYYFIFDIYWLRVMLGTWYIYFLLASLTSYFESREGDIIPRSHASPHWINLCSSYFAHPKGWYHSTLTVFILIFWRIAPRSNNTPWHNIPSGHWTGQVSLI